MSRLNSRILALLLSFPVLLFGCKSTPTPQPPLAVSAIACSSAAALKEPPLDSSFSSNKVLGGGVVRSGDFRLEAYLYCDPALSPDNPDPASQSAISGLGVHTAWRYEGPDIAGPVELFWGFGNEAQPSGGWDGGLTRGSSASYTGGIVSAEAVSAITKGDMLSLAFSIKANAASAGASLSFDMAPSGDGYAPSEIAIESLQ
jgi:hypothetical protein